MSAQQISTMSNISKDTADFLKELEKGEKKIHRMRQRRATEEAF